MEDHNVSSLEVSAALPSDFYPYTQVPKDSDLDELIFYGLEWNQSER